MPTFSLRTLVLGQLLVVGGRLVSASYSNQHNKPDSEQPGPGRYLVEASAREIVKFYAFGDAPHGDRERQRFPAQLQRMESRPDFLVHLGDFHERQKNCDLSQIDNAADSLVQQSTLPVFAVPGDSDWYNCNDQESAWEKWSTRFLRFEDNWNHQFQVRHQASRIENWSFKHKGVLFVSFHILASSVRDWDVWNQKVHDDVLWLESELVSNAFQDSIGAIVLMAHAQPHTRRYREFYDSLMHLASRIEKPMLYLHGSDDEFNVAKDFPSENILRVSVARGGDEDPMEIVVDPSGPVPFTFKRHALP